MYFFNIYDHRQHKPRFLPYRHVNLINLSNSKILEKEFCQWKFVALFRLITNFKNASEKI